MGDDMDKAAERRRETRLRRMAAGMGLALRKSRARDACRMDFGCYRIVDSKSERVVAGRFPYGYTLDLDAVEEVLDELETSREEEEFARVHMSAPGSGKSLDAKWGH
jgi:hypothetical protein